MIYQSICGLKFIRYSKKETAENGKERGSLKKSGGLKGTPIKDVCEAFGGSTSMILMKVCSKKPQPEVLVT